MCDTIGQEHSSVPIDPTGAIQTQVMRLRRIEEDWRALFRCELTRENMHRAAAVFQCGRDVSKTRDDPWEVFLPALNALENAIAEFEEEVPCAEG